MKNFLINSKLIAFALIAFFSISTNAQELTPTLPIEEIQEMMLIEHKISFNSQQMELNSIKVAAIADPEKAIEPTLTISPEQTLITIDFSKCESGDYLISGKNGDATIKFIVKHIK
jgi:signal recognition particle receptor subunit beta